MQDLLSELLEKLTGNVAWIGVGNPDYGDDGFGPALAKALCSNGCRHIVPAGSSPERWVMSDAVKPYDHIVFVDAVEFGADPGSVVFLDSARLRARFPQVSTHKISLGTLAQFAEAQGTTRAWLLGVQPGSLKTGEPLSPQVEQTCELLRDLIACWNEDKGQTRTHQHDRSEQIPS